MGAASVVAGKFGFVWSLDSRCLVTCAMYNFWMRRGDPVGIRVSHSFARQPASAKYRESAGALPPGRPRESGDPYAAVYREGTGYGPLLSQGRRRGCRAQFSSLPGSRAAAIQARGGRRFMNGSNDKTHGSRTPGLGAWSLTKLSISPLFQPGDSTQPLHEYFFATLRPARGSEEEKKDSMRM